MRGNEWEGGLTLSDRAYPVPSDEEGRQLALERYEVLDSPPERFYDDVAMLAAAICGTPIAMVSLIALVVCHHDMTPGA